MNKHLLRVAAFKALLVATSLLLLTSPPALADDYADAVRLLKQGETAAALRKADAAIAANRDDARARFLKGLILTEQNKTQAAIEVFTALTRDFPELPEPYNNLAVLYAAQGEYDKARNALEMAIRTHPSYAVAHENLGDVYAKMASEAYDKALSLDRGNQTAQTKLSLIRELFSETAAQVQIAKTPSTSTNNAVAPASAASAAPATPAPAESSAPSKLPAAPQSTQQQEAALIAAVNAWANAWSGQDLSAYLSHYAPAFDPPGQLSRSAWEQQRRSRVGRPKFIRVEVSEPAVTLKGLDRATVRFRQHYQSDTIDSTGHKTLTMIKSGEQWLIIREQFEDR
ncbi:MAG: tetratricopeptide repeat protein [Burkholderiales bacterium]|jgi:tetratricopeptide (TPR) repeat protein